MINFLKKEISDFKKLSSGARELLKINFIYSIASIISSTFVGTYLWGKTADIRVFLTYYSVMFITLPLAFYLNGLFLKKVNIIKMHVAGIFVNLLTVVFLMFIEDLEIYHMIFAGIGMAFGLAFYWANRGYFSQLVVKNEERDMFNSSGSAIDIIPSVILPSIIGYFLVTGERYDLYSKSLAYKALGLIAMLLGFILYYFAKNIKISNPKIGTFKTNNRSQVYSKFKIFIFSEGIKSGVLFFIPSILILNYVGQEDVLGNVLSFSSVLAAIMIYIIGKKIQSSKRTYARAITIILWVVLSANIAINPGYLSVVAYVIGSALTTPIVNSVFFTVHQLSINKMKRDDGEVYPYLLATEIYLNFGRLFGLLILFGLYYTFGEIIALRSIILIVTTAMLITIIPIERLNKEVSN